MTNGTNIHGSIANAVLAHNSSENGEIFENIIIKLICGHFGDSLYFCSPEMMM